MAEWDAMARDAYAHDVKLKKGVKTSFVAKEAGY